MPLTATAGLLTAGLWHQLFFVDEAPLSRAEEALQARLNPAAAGFGKGNRQQ